MNKIIVPELLAPCGSIESLYAAVNSGCDAVYLGGKNFSARNSANNFSNKEIEEAVDFCHLRNVKVYITINTLYKNSELNEILEFTKMLYNFGVDAFIVQDIGTAFFIREHFKDIHLHGSTQMTVHDLEGVLFMEKLGFNRVCLSRELSIEEIETIKSKTNIEIEIFAHGALCVCYSGQCLMSSLLGGRSGNRGKCAQPCRLKYDFYKDDDLIENGYLLSPKDLMTLDFLEEVVTTKVDSIKIEGRMKNSEYVTAVVTAYRKTLDSIENSDFKLEKETIKDVKQIFNRGGTFTKGYFKNYSGLQMISERTSKSTGNYVGKVKFYKNERCAIELSEDLNAGDGIEIWTKTEPHTGTNINGNFFAGSVIDINIEGDIQKGDPVFKSYDKKLNDKLKVAQLKPIRKHNIKASITAIINKPLSLKLSKESITVEVFGEVVEKAQKQPLTKEKLFMQFSKTGETPFSFEFEDCNIGENIYIGISSINALRRQAVEEFSEKYILTFKRNIENIENPVFEKKTFDKSKKLTVLCNNIEQVKMALQDGVEKISVEYSNSVFENSIFSTAKNYNIKLYIALPRIISEDEDLLKIIEKIEKSDFDGYLLRTYGELNLLKDSKKEKLADYSFNAFNSLSLKFLENHFETIAISPELTLAEINEIGTEKTEVIVYGRQILMVTNQCPVGIYEAYKEEGKFCSLKNKEGNYFLKDRKDKNFPIIRDCENCKAYILNSDVLFTLNKIKDIKNINAKYVRLDFTNESPEMARDLVHAYIENLKKDMLDFFTEDLTDKYLKIGVTNGHFYRGVE